MAERKSLAEWGFIVTVLLGGVFLAFSGVVAKIAGWLLILLGIGLTIYWWADLRKLWLPAESEGEIEAKPKKLDAEEGFGFMSAYASTSMLAIPNRTTLMGYVSVEVVNHSSTVARKVLDMRLALFDLATGREREPGEPVEFEIHPQNEEYRLIQPLGRRVLGLHATATFAGHLDRESAPECLFLMMRVAGLPGELKVPLGKELFS